MFRRFFLATAIGLAIGAVVSNFETNEQRDNREWLHIYETKYEAWVKVAKETCITPPPPDFEGFKKWASGPELGGEMLADAMRRKVNGEPTCLEELLASQRLQQR